MIGAVATMSTAIFQLYSALRSRNKFDVRPNKKGMTFRSILSIVALMIASGAGGYIYSELKHQSASDDIHSMRDELNAKLQLLAATTERLAAQKSGLATNAAEKSETASVESVIYAPACVSGVSCAEANSQRLALCGAIPASMHIRKMELFAKAANAQTPWEQSAATFEQDVGGAKFTGAPVEHAEGSDRKAVCVDFMHWSTEPHMARLVLQYGAAVEPESNSQGSAVAAAPTSAPSAHIASMAPAAASP